MTIHTKSVLPITLNGNGGTVYSFPFRIFDDTIGSTNKSVLVLLLDSSGGSPVVQIQGTDYTVTATAAETGQIVFSNPVPSTQKILIVSAISYTQEVSFPNNQTPSAVNVELMGDRLEAQIKQIAGKLEYCLTIPYPNGVPVDVTIDPAEFADGDILSWEQVAPDKFKITTLPINAQQLTTLVQDAQTAAANAQSAASNAQGVLSNVNSVYSSTLTLSSSVISAKQDVDAKAAQVAADLAATTLAAQAAQAAAQSAVFLPDPTGAPQGKAALTDGQGDYVLGDVAIVENLQTAPQGSSVVVSVDAQGKKTLTASTLTVANSRQITTTEPALEGGTDVGQALENNFARIQRVMSAFNLSPWGTTAVVAEFSVAQDGSLISRFGNYKISPDNTPDVVRIDANGHYYYATASEYTIPDTIGTKNVFQGPTSIVFAFTPTPTSPQRIILDKSDLTIRYIATGVLEIASGGVFEVVPVELGELNTVMISFDGVAVTGQTGHFDQGTNAVALEILPPMTLSVPITAGGFNFLGGVESRFIELALVNTIVNHADFETYSNTIFNSQVVGGIVPVPNTGQTGQTPVISGNTYSLEYGLVLDNIPNGFTVNNNVDTSAIPDSGVYNIVLRKDNSAQTLEVELMPEQITQIGAKTYMSTLAFAQPTKLADLNVDRCSLAVQNNLDDNIIVGTLADLTLDRTNGFKVLPDGTMITLPWTDEVYAITESDTQDASGVLTIVESVLINKP